MNDEPQKKGRRITVEARQGTKQKEIKLLKCAKCGKEYIYDSASIVLSVEVPYECKQSRSHKFISLELLEWAMLE